MAEERNDITGTLGIDRWVQFAFIAAAVAISWLLIHVVTAAWTRFGGEPDEIIVRSASIVGGVLCAVALYRAPKLHRFANEVAVELAKVTWPNRKETWAQTVVVLVVSALAALVVGAFDALWSAFTDLIYKV